MRRHQTRATSLAEAAANVVAGFWVAVATQRLVFPLFRIDTAFTTDLAIGATFTVVSIIRSYLMRRLFERIGTDATKAPPVA